MIPAEKVELSNIADNDYGIHPLLKHRYSPRTFQDKPIENVHLNQLFEAIRWSASSNNLQPWRFIYAHKGTSGYDSIVNCLSDFNKTWATNAPLLMLSAYKEKTDDGKENFHALHDLGLSLGSFTFQAQHLGIAVHHMAGVDWKKAQEVFGVPKGYHITTAIAVGYYGGDIEKLSEDLQKQEVSERERIDIEEFAFPEKWEK